MPFYETVYETGRMSVACYDDDEQAKAALYNHNRRAMNGESGGPLGQPAERIAAVYVYSEHPNEYNPEQTASADVVQKEIESLIKATKDKNGVINIDQLAVEIRGLSHPMVSGGETFDSFFKAKEDKKLNLDFLTEGNA